MFKTSLFWLRLLLIFLLFGCQVDPALPLQSPAVPIQASVRPPSSATAPVEAAVREIPLTGPASAQNAELSGLAWFGDWLVMLPQYPERFPSGPDGSFFALRRSEIADYLSGKSTALLNPRLIPLTAPGLRALPGYEGFEAIAIAGARLYVTIEASAGSMQAYLVSGEISGDLAGISLQPSPLAKITPQVNITNMSDEALLLLPNGVVAFDEVNAAQLNAKPAAHFFSPDLNPAGELAFPNLEYRVTDASMLDADNRFWVINYFYPGDTKIAPQHDPIAEAYGKGSTHAQSKVVERLVQLEWKSGRFSLAPVPPVQLQLLPENTARNWEGLAQWSQQSFLLVTDSFPKTILAYVDVH